MFAIRDDAMLRIAASSFKLAIKTHALVVRWRLFKCILLHPVAEVPLAKSLKLRANECPLVAKIDCEDPSLSVTVRHWLRIDRSLGSGAMDIASSDRIAVIRLKGLTPEVFLILVGKRRHPSGFVWTASLELSESEVRDELARIGNSIEKSDSVIEQARANPM